MQHRYVLGPLGVLAAVAPFGLIVAIASCDDPVAPDPGGPGGLELAYAFADLPEGDFLVQFEFQSDGSLWARSFEGRLVQWNDGAPVIHAPGEPYGGGPARDLFIDEADRVWVAAGIGIARYDGQWTWIAAPAEVTPGTSISHIAANLRGDILIAAGHFGVGGILLSRDGGWQAFTPANSRLPSSITHEIRVDHQGAFWVASGGGHGGISRIEGTEIAEVLTLADGLLYSAPDDLAPAHDRVYVAFAVIFYDQPGADGGLQAISRRDGSVKTWFPDTTGVVSSRVRSLALTADGDVWFTTGLDEAQPTCPRCFSGIGRLRGGQRLEVLSAVTYQHDALAPNEFLPWISADPEGEVYVIAGDGRGIYRVFRSGPWAK